MSSRDEILRAVRRNRPEPVALPPLPEPAPPPADRVEAFRLIVREIGGHVLDAEDARGAAAVLAGAYPDARAVCSLVPDLVPGTVDPALIQAPHQLAHVDLFVGRGELGVAENGAVWVRDGLIGHRAAPFLAEHLALLLPRDRIVPDLHAAYARLRVDEDGFGLFIAGPSKTADIEQSLVIGAHGPRSLTVVLV